jgi:hypothetical protein
MDPIPKDYWGRRACAVISSFNGAAADGEKAMAPLLKAVPPPIFNWMGAMPFPARSTCRTTPTKRGAISYARAQTPSWWARRRSAG